MKNKSILLTLFTIIIVIMSCKKYPDGPAFSLRSKTARVANSWKMEKVLYNGTDVTSSYTNINYTETYEKDGNYSYSTTSFNGSGKWSFENKDTQIKRQGVSGQTTQDLTILQLKENHFSYTFTDGKDNYEFHLIPN